MVNVKLSIKLSDIRYQDILYFFKDSNVKFSPNFIVIFDKFTYTIFRPNLKTGNIHCNITKVRSFSKVTEALEFIKTSFPLASIEEQSIDNITARFEIRSKLNLDVLFRKLYNAYEIKYNLQKFPALFIKIPISNRTITIFVFTSGKIVCVGAKELLQLELVSNWITSQIQV